MSRIWTAAPDRPQIPVTVLTGFLGAGKTTLLNRILTENHGRKFAVIINEFGETGIDNDLVIDADEEVFEMNTGCICCTVRGALIRIIGGLMKRKGLDGILIETTGPADPAPVAQTFYVDADVAARTRLDAIVTVADAVNLSTHLDESHEAAEQIAYADIVLLNKTDLVDTDTLTAVEARLRAMNWHARIPAALIWKPSSRSSAPIGASSCFDFPGPLADVAGRQHRAFHADAKAAARIVWCLQERQSSGPVSRMCQ